MTQDFTHEQFASWPYLHRVRADSLLRCERLGAKLASVDLVREHVSTIFAVGSAGRLELGSGSDLDGVVILKHSLGDEEVSALMHAIESCYVALDFAIAKGAGIYREPVLPAQLLDVSQRGSLNEAPTVYGKRIQIMLDARPLFGGENFAQLQSEVLTWFTPSSLSPDSPYGYFLNELKRYYHSYSAWQNFKFDKSNDDGWLLRQAKLRITRMVTIAAAIISLGVCSDDNISFDLRRHISTTPLERILKSFECYGESESLREFLTDYESTLKMMHNPAVREELIAASPHSFEEFPETLPASYLQLYAISRRLSNSIAEFILRRRGDWTMGFYRDCLL
ncbi:MAG: hypothetical protein ACU84Q_10550 [Gammaproteobacteria bacterium]